MMSSDLFDFTTLACISLLQKSMTYKTIVPSDQILRSTPTVELNSVATGMQAAGLQGERLFMMHPSQLLAMFSTSSFILFSFQAMDEFLRNVMSLAFPGCPACLWIL